MRLIVYFVAILGVTAKPPNFYECAFVNNNECASFNLGICCQIFPYNSEAYTNCMGYCVNTVSDYFKECFNNNFLNSILRNFYSLSNELLTAWRCR